MNNEEKILAMLETLTGKVDGLSGTVEKHGGLLTQMQREQKQMREDITGIKLHLDYDVNKRFDAINEGIDSILEQLTPKSRVDALEADVVVLKTALKALTQEVAELKKVQ